MLSELLAQKAEIEAKIAAAKADERAAAIKQARELVQAHGLTAEEVGAVTARAKLLTSFAKPKATAKARVAPKFADGTGNTWSGRGIKPNWLQAALNAGATLEQFRIVA